MAVVLLISPLPFDRSLRRNHNKKKTRKRRREEIEGGTNDEEKQFGKECEPLLKEDRIKNT